MARFRKYPRELVAERIIDKFVGIQEQHPGRLDPMVSEEPVPLLGESSIPAEIDPIGAGGSGDIARAIGGPGIDDHHARETTKTWQAVSEVALLVAYGDDDGDRQHLGHFGRERGLVQAYP